MFSVYTSEESLMRSRASHWISPEDRELTRFATGHDHNPGSAVDWEKFIAECEHNQRHYAGTDADRDELQSLIRYARNRMNYS